MADWFDDPLELAVRDFCFGDGRALPPSVFLGRVVAVGDPMWLPEDRVAALEWQAYHKTLCPGCGRPRTESFDIGMEDHYDVTELQCHACAARDSRAWNTRPDSDSPPTFGRFFVVRPDEDAPTAAAHA